MTKREAKRVAVGDELRRRDVRWSKPKTVAVVHDPHPNWLDAPSPLFEFTDEPLAA